MDGQMDTYIELVPQQGPPPTKVGSPGGIRISVVELQVCFRSGCRSQQLYKFTTGMTDYDCICRWKWIIMKLWTFLLKRTNEIQYISNLFNCGLISICSGFESFVVDLGYIFMTGLTDYFCIGKVFFIFEGLIWPGILALMFPELTFSYLR